MLKRSKELLLLSSIKFSMIKYLQISLFYPKKWVFQNKEKIASDMNLKLTNCASFISGLNMNGQGLDDRYDILSVNKSLDELGRYNFYLFFFPQTSF